MKKIARPEQRTQRARSLRHTQTDVEALLWARLRHRQLGGMRFRRQHPIGPYFVDFCCVEARIVIELDGGQHAGVEDRDEARSEVLRELGYRVLRFWNNEVVSNIEAVLERIASFAKPS